MDWDYWSPANGRFPPRVWGIRCDVARPETWPKLFRNLFGPYFRARPGRKTPPFPYVRFLRDHGFQVIVASAVRSHGDNFCVPFPEHVANVVGAAKVAADSHVLGSIITSWALRRSPWPLTEYGLIAGAMTMNDPTVSRRRIDAAFAAEHFGAADPALAGIPQLLGAPVRGYLDAMPVHDPETGRWPGRDYAHRIESVVNEPVRFRREMARLRANIVQARRLLDKARPATAQQRERLALWRWAADVLEHFARFGPQILKPPGTHDHGELRRFRRAALRLQRRTDRTLRPIYTYRTMLDERQTRFGIHLDYLDAMLAAT